MGCRNRRDEEDIRLASPSLVNDALLLTTMCLIGLSVDVHIKDGSVYSGIFHTASVHDPYAIVLKRAKMMKKGSCNSNVANADVIGTLIIQSQDLVQVVAKKVMIPADGLAGHRTGDETGAVACSFPSNGLPLTELNNTMTSKSNVGQPHFNQTRCLSGTENDFADGYRPENSSHLTNALEVKDTDVKGSTKKEECLKDPDDNSRMNDNHTSSSTPSETVTTKISNSNRTAKEFKLNPGAKIFSPSIPNKRSPTPQAIMTGTNLVYNLDNHPSGLVAAPQPEVEISPFAPRSVPVKLVPYGGNDMQHPPIVGYMTNRSQPVRYGPYHPVQTAPTTFVQPNSQNVMVGRLGPVVYVHHPVSQDMIPSTNSFSSVLTPPQLHVTKHHGTMAAQALQLSSAPPFIGGGGGQAPYVLPSHIPISQLPYPVMHPISIPGSNGFLVSKYS